MPDSIDLGRYSVFVPPDPFEDHVGPFYYRIRATRAKPAACIACCRPSTRHGNYAGGVHGGATLAFADYALCLVAGRAADGGTNTSFAMTVSIAVEFLDAGRVGLPLEASGEPLAGDRPARLRARQRHPAGPHHRAVVGRVPPRSARQGDGDARRRRRPPRPSSPRACRPASSCCRTPASTPAISARPTRARKRTAPRWSSPPCRTCATRAACCTAAT